MLPPDKLTSQERWKYNLYRSVEVTKVSTDDTDAIRGRNKCRSGVERDKFSTYRMSLKVSCYIVDMMI